MSLRVSPARAPCSSGSAGRRERERAKERRTRSLGKVPVLERVLVAILDAEPPEADDGWHSERPPLALALAAALADLARPVRHPERHLAVVQRVRRDELALVGLVELRWPVRRALAERVALEAVVGGREARRRAVAGHLGRWRSGGGRVVRRRVRVRVAGVGVALRRRRVRVGVCVGAAVVQRRVRRLALARRREVVDGLDERRAEPGRRWCAEARRRGGVRLR